MSAQKGQINIASVIGRKELLKKLVKKCQSYLFIIEQMIRRLEGFVNVANNFQTLYNACGSNTYTQYNSYIIVFQTVRSRTNLGLVLVTARL